jgi:ADP-ribosylglycohydrolase
MRTLRQEQFSGCLVGQCLGDALGFPVEGFPDDVCGDYVRGLRELADPGRLPGRAGFPFGQYTDDSQLAREWMQSYAALGRFEPADYAERTKNIFAENRIVGRGLATDAAARRLAQGVPWEQAGTPAPSAGNGAAMRAAPVGLIFAGDPDRMIQVACDQSRITHQDKRCWAGAVAIAGAAALAAASAGIEPEQFVRQLAGWIGQVSEPFAADILHLPEWLRLPPERAAPLIARCGAPDFVDEWRWISPYVVPSVLWSLYSFLRTPEDYWETVCTAIEAGGDVDTTAAMAGAISGAHVSLERLPLEFARRVNDQGTWGFDELVELAHRCHALCAQ